MAELVHDAVGDANFALVGEKRSADQTKKGRFPAPGQTHDGDTLPLGTTRLMFLRTSR